jgi:hypothetical protein
MHGYELLVQQQVADRLREAEALRLARSLHGADPQEFPAKSRATEPAFRRLFKRIAGRPSPA